MEKNPQWYTDNQWKLWELHLDEVVKEAHENPQVELNFLIKKPSVSHEARDIKTDK